MTHPELVSMTEKRNALLLASLQRSGRPLTGEELLDVATGLGLDEGWTPDNLRLDPKSVAARMVNLKREGLVEIVEMKRDADRRADTPVYQPTAGWDPRAVIPRPTPQAERRTSQARTTESPSDYDAMTPRQLRSILEAQDLLLESTGRLLQHVNAGLKDLALTREKVRLRLQAEGLEAR